MAGPRAGPATDRGADRDGLPAGTGRHRGPAPAARTRGRRSPGSTAPTSSSRRPTAPPRTTAGAASLARASNPRRCGGHRVRADAAGRRGARRAAARRGLRRGGVPRRHGGRPRAAGGTRTSWPTECRSWSRRRRSAWASTSRTSAGSCTSRCRTPRTATCRRSAAPDATASRRGPCCCTARRTSRCSDTSAGSPPAETEVRDLVAVLRAAPAHPRRAARRSAASARRKLTQLVTLLEQVGAVVVRRRRRAGQPRLRAPAGRGGPAGAGRSGTPPDRAADPDRHDATVRRSPHVPWPGAAGLLRRPRSTDRAATATTATTGRSDSPWPCQHRNARTQPGPSRSR